MHVLEYHFTSLKEQHIATTISQCLKRTFFINELIITIKKDNLPVNPMAPVDEMMSDLHCRTFSFPGARVYYKHRTHVLLELHFCYMLSHMSLKP